MIYRTFPVGSFQCNCSLLACEETKEAILIDPGDEAEEILSVVRELGVKVLYAIHTHAHLDHIGATKKVSEETGCEILLHKEDLFLYENLPMQASLFGLEAEEPTPPHRFVDDEEEIIFGKCRLEVIHTPGHTPGSICFQIEEAGPSLFTGDTLFQNGIGRTDLWGSDRGWHHHHDQHEHAHGR